MGLEHGRQWRLTVRTYVAGGFAVCVALLVALVWMASGAASRHERNRAFRDLDAAAHGGATWLDPAQSVVVTLQNLVENPKIASLDTAQCQPAFDALASGVLNAHLHVFDATGREVCALRVPGEGVANEPLPRGTWADRVAKTGDLVITDVLTDPLSDHLSVIYALPIGTDGGVFAAVVYTGAPPVDVPGVVKGVRLIVLDRHREQIIASAANVKVKLGTSVRDTALAHAVPRGRTILDVDGHRRYYQEAVVPTLGWHVLAGYDESVALAAARSERRWLFAIGGALVSVIVVLGLLLLTRVARPLRRFSAALMRSREGDNSARAPVAGPAEVATAASLFNDLIEDRIARETDLRQRATHDSLTGLANRAAVEALLDSLTASHAACAVLFLDLGRFKLVNDVHGHTIGDELLVKLAASLSWAVGDEGVLARFGGDEFVAVLPDVEYEHQATAIATRMLDVVRAPIVVGDGLELFVTGSIGIAVALPGDDATTLLRNADIAMYRSKSAGAGGFQLFDAAMREWDVQRLTVEHDLHRALERGELVIHYQPIRHLDEPSVWRAEALVRWRHPTRGLLYPGDFLEVAEDAGLLSRLGSVVLAEAAATAAALPGLEVSVNVAPAQLAGGALVEQVRSTLAASGLAPERLCVEITETGLLEDLDAVADVLSRIRALGVNIAIDDFGTGWSSLSWLQRLPADEVKVDRSFVARLTSDPVSAAIVRALADLSKTLGMRIVAEGVETAEQLDSVRALGIDAAQGFLLGRPHPADELARPQTLAT